MKRIVFTATLGLLASSLFAGPIMEEYYKLEKEIADSRKTDESQKKQLETTLLKSLQRSLARYYKYKDAEKLTASDFQYEASETDPNTFFVKFKDFTGYFSYHNDPRLYTSFPWDEKLIVKPGTEFEKEELPIDNKKKEDEKTSETK